MRNKTLGSMNVPLQTDVNERIVEYELAKKKKSQHDSVAGNQPDLDNSGFNPLSAQLMDEERLRLIALELMPCARSGSNTERFVSLRAALDVSLIQSALLLLQEGNYEACKGVATLVTNPKALEMIITAASQQHKHTAQALKAILDSREMSNCQSKTTENKFEPSNFLVKQETIRKQQAENLEPVKMSLSSLLTNSIELRENAKRRRVEE